jgi:hypothetical protein
MKQAACVLLSLLLWACEPASLPDPSIVSVAPERVPAGLPSSLSVRVSAALPIVVDYQDEAVDPSQVGMKVRLGGQEVDIPFAEPDGTLIVPVPEGLAVGAYDVQVTLADGREALREHAFQVLPAPSLNGGSAGGDGGTQGDGGSEASEPILEISGGISGFHIARRGPGREDLLRAGDRARQPGPGGDRLPRSLRSRRAGGEDLPEPGGLRDLPSGRGQSRPQGAVQPFSRPPALSDAESAE